MAISFRTVFISDVHLGSKGCQADRLLEFIKAVECDRLYLVGDIVDGWKLKGGWSWPQAHADVVQKILRMARKGVEVIYIPGNHDDRVRDFCGVHLGGVVVQMDAIHTTADGRRFLVTHGDAFDGIVNQAKWLEWVGDYSYRALIVLNRRWNGMRRRLGMGDWSLSAFLKLQVKNAVRYIDDFEGALAEEARRRGVDGVVCGHIHHAKMRRIGDILYVNDGDWVESCTAVVERHDGALELIAWDKVRHIWRNATSEDAAPADAPSQPTMAPAREAALV
jgi:UDP-2,3-diacylglucosamine pyrophosphatase LpxH